jgi:hypothetical protein
MDAIVLPEETLLVLYFVAPRDLGWFAHCARRNDLGSYPSHEQFAAMRRRLQRVRDNAASGLRTALTLSTLDEAVRTVNEAVDRATSADVRGLTYQVCLRMASPAEAERAGT